MARMMVKTAPAYDSLREFLVSLPASFDSLGTLIFSGRNQLRLVDWEGKKLVVKSFKRDGLIKKCINRFRLGKAYKSFVNANEILSRGINTPAPIGYVEVHNYFGFRTSQYYVCEFVDFKPIEDFVSSDDVFDISFMSSLAKYFARLHQLGIFHGDLNNTNVRYQIGFEGYNFFLIDTNRMKFAQGEEISADECLLNLTHFSEDTKGFRFLLKEYLRTRGWNESLFELALKIKYRNDAGYRRKRKVKLFFKSIIGKA